MSTVLFDAPGPKARRRHTIVAVVVVVLLAAVAVWVLKKLNSEGVLTTDVAEEVFSQNNVDFIREGFVGTLKAAALGIAGSILFGLLFAAGRLSDHRWLRWPSITVIEFFRAVPLVLLILGNWYAYKDTVGTLMS